MLPGSSTSAAVLVALALALPACGGDDRDSSTTEDPSGSLFGVDALHGVPLL